MISSLSRFGQPGPEHGFGGTESPKVLTWLKAIVYMELFTALTIFVFTLLGVSVSRDVERCFLLALLELLITLPGVAYVFKSIKVARLIYAGLQFITSTCEILWVIVLVKDSEKTSKCVVMAVLAVIQMMGGIVALCAHDKALPCVRRKKKTGVSISHSSFDISALSSVGPGLPPGSCVGPTLGAGPGLNPAPFHFAPLANPPSDLPTTMPPALLNTYPVPPPPVLADPPLGATPFDAPAPVFGSDASSSVKTSVEEKKEKKADKEKMSPKQRRKASKERYESTKRRLETITMNKAKKPRINSPAIATSKVEETLNKLRADTPPEMKEKKEAGGKEKKEEKRDKSDKETTISSLRSTMTAAKSGKEEKEEEEDGPQSLDDFRNKDKLSPATKSTPL